MKVKILLKNSMKVIEYKNIDKTSGKLHEKTNGP
jgi:hypothetical protein